MRARPRVCVLIVIASLVLSAGLAGCAGGGGGGSDGAKEASGEPLRIGAVLSLTGTYSGLGEPEKNTLEMEVERINKAGGVAGRKIELTIEDDATDPAQAQAAASKLLQRGDMTAIIGATGTGQTMAMRADIERAQVPQLSVAGGSVVTDELSEWVFQTPWPNRIVVPFVLKAIKADGHTRVALVSDTGGYGKDGRDYVLKVAKELGMEVVADEVFNPGDTDMSSQLTKVRGSDAQAILMWNAGKEAAIIAKNREQLQIDLPLYGASGNARKEFAEGAGGAAEGFKFGTGRILVPSSFGEDSENHKIATAFTQRYEERYGKAPDIFAAHAYDALYLIVGAVERLDGEFTPSELRDEIEKTSGWPGLDGTFTYSPEDHNGLTEKDLVMYEIKGGDWVLAE